MAINDNSRLKVTNTVSNSYRCTPPYLLQIVYYYSRTSSLFTMAANVNGTATAIIAYVFAEKQGYSKFGGYTGNGNVDGAFIYTGFRPAFLMIKRYDSTNDWKMMDDKRPGYNVTSVCLNANTNAGTDTSDFLDILSNGFKTRKSSQDVNGSGSTYLYMAFAEFPIVSSNDVPTVAR